MGRLMIAPGGAGTSSDEVTANKSDILKGVRTIARDSNDEIAEGTLELTGNIVASDIPAGKTGYSNNAKSKITGTKPVRGPWLGTVGMNSSVTIPEGIHDGKGKVNGPAVTQRGAFVRRLAINEKVMIPEGYHNGLGYFDQVVPVQGGSTTTPGTANKTVVAANRYVNGNIIVAGDPNLIPANIKKNVVMFGVKGAHDGFVADISDIYKRGTFGNGFYITHILDGGSTYAVEITSNQANINVFTVAPNSISARSISCLIKLNKFINFSAYSKINFVVSRLIGTSSTTNYGRVNAALSAMVLDTNGKTVLDVDYYAGGHVMSGEITGSIDVTNINFEGMFVIELGAKRTSVSGDSVANDSLNPYIHRIWLS